MSKKKNEPVKLAPEQKRENDLRRIIDERTKYMPEPTYQFAVGDRVDIGHLRDAVIHADIGNGIYEIDYTDFNNNYGRPIIKEHQRIFFAWYDIRPHHESPKESLIKNADVRLNYSQMSMNSLFGKVYFFGTDFDPEYQREFVWELDDKVALIDSIFNNIDIGKFVFIHKDYGNEFLYEILDGKQRMRAILDFYENRFQYKGLYYNDLCIRDRCHFKEYPVSIAEVSDCDRQQALKYFVMLNKHGRIMDKAQIEKVERMIEG